MQWCGSGWNSGECLADPEGLVGGGVGIGCGKGTPPHPGKGLEKF